MKDLELSELDELYKSNDLITVDEEEFLACDLPDLDDIWTVEEFSKKVEDHLKYTELTREWESKFKLVPNIDNETVLGLIDETMFIEESLNKLEGFQQDILVKSIRDNVYQEFWTEIFEDYNMLKDDYDNYRRILFKNDYYIPRELITEDTLLILGEIIDTNKETPINWFNGITKPRWKKLSNSITNDDKPIEKLDDYQNIKILVSYEIENIRGANMKKVIIPIIIAVVIIIFATSNNKEIEKKDLEKIIEVLKNKRYKVPEGNKINLTEDGIEKNKVICKITTLGEKGSIIIYIYNKAISIIDANDKTKLYEIIDGINQEEILMIQKRSIV